MVRVENEYSIVMDEPRYVDLCDCADHWVEQLSLRVEHVKREYYWIIKEFVCINCEMVWEKRTYCIGQGDNWKIKFNPEEGEE